MLPFARSILATGALPRAQRRSSKLHRRVQIADNARETRGGRQLATRADSSRRREVLGKINRAKCKTSASVQN